MTTIADDLAIQGGVWRTARKPKICNYLHRDRRRIEVGERYFDSSELDPYATNPFSTIPLCADCANSQRSTPN